MPAPVPFSSPHSQSLFPALYLYPLNDSFVPKHIALLGGSTQHVKIGRQTNAKTVPGERNGYFDSKVLSRQHAEVWEDSNKIYIKDVKSSNGTFINGERLSPEGLESDPYELKSDDIVEFGIDIVGEDNKTIIHHKVAARIFCVFSEQDAQIAARTEQNQQAHHQQQQQQSQHQSPHGSHGQHPSSSMQAGPSSVSSFNFSGGGSGGSGGNGSGPSSQRRPPMQQQGLSGMGGMGGSMRPPGKSGLTFDHILSRLQGELQKSRDTGAELHNLTGAMNEIHDTLGGTLPPNIQAHPHTLPPVRPPQPQPQPSSHPDAAGDAPSGPPAPGPASSPSHHPPSSALSELQSQLHDTQSSLATHVDKIRALEGVLKEQETIRREVGELRQIMEARGVREHLREDRGFSVEEDLGMGGLGDRDRGRARDDDRDGELSLEVEMAVDEEPDEDDARSINTVIPHELERVEEEDEDQLAAASAEEDEERERDGEDERESEEEEEEEEERRRRREELGRPRTPEPTGLGMRREDYEMHRSSTLLAAPRRRSTSPPAPSTSTAEPLSDLPSDTQSISSAHPPTHADLSPTDLTALNARLTTLSHQLETALSLSTSLQAQHAAAQSTILALETKVGKLEELMRDTLAAQEAATAAAAVVAPAADATTPSPIDEAKDHAPSTSHESLTQMLTDWKKGVEGQWTSVQEEWNQERERLSRAREEWEVKVRQVDSGLAELAALHAQGRDRQLGKGDDERRRLENGDASKQTRGHRLNGLVTPPSPSARSLSADSDSGRGGVGARARRKRSGSGAGSGSGSESRGRSSRTRSRSRSGSRSPGMSAEDDFLTDGTSNTSVSFDEGNGDVFGGSPSSGRGKGGKGGARSLVTPEPSLRQLAGTLGLTPSPPRSGDGVGGGEVEVDVDGEVDGDSGVEPDQGKNAVARQELGDTHSINVSTAVGVLMLSIAAAAVIWRVKPE